jgi:MFS family permease
MLPWTVTPMFVAPIAGSLADRYGNRPFMTLGLLLQAAGYGWIALIAGPDVGYAQLGVALTVAGVGTSLCFPTVANAVLGSVPPSEAGVASGTNSALRELGGVFGVAVLASVFAHNGGYGSPQSFADGFTPALWAALGLSAVGVIAAVLSSPLRRQAPAVALATAAD